MSNTNSENPYVGRRFQELVQKILMKKAAFGDKSETLAEYYVRVHGHLLGDISVFEISDNGDIKDITEERKVCHE